MFTITDVKIRKITRSTETGKLKAVASIVIDGAFVIHDIKLIDGIDGLFMAMPSRKATDGTFMDIAHPINSEVREIVKTAVLKAYNEAE